MENLILEDGQKILFYMKNNKEHFYGSEDSDDDDFIKIFENDQYVNAISFPDYFKKMQKVSFKILP